MFVLSATSVHIFICAPGCFIVFKQRVDASVVNCWVIDGIMTNKAPSEIARELWVRSSVSWPLSMRV